MLKKLSYKVIWLKNLSVLIKSGSDTEFILKKLMKVATRMNLEVYILMIAAMRVKVRIVS